MADGTNKLVVGSSAYANASSFQLIKYGEVVENFDKDGLGRIKVRILGSGSAGGDNNTTTADLGFALPLLPKHLSIIPKIGDMVWVLVFNKDTQHSDRLYIGPIVSQLDKLNGEQAKISSMRGFSFAPTTHDKPISEIPQLTGVFPKDDDISIQGRFNTDITQSRNEVVIRAGKFEEVPSSAQNPYTFQFNATTQAYIQIKNDVQITKPDANGISQKGTITTIVANKINLLTHANGSPRFNLTGQDTLITEDEMGNILDSAHQLAFGDVQLQYLILLKEAFLAHVHNGSGNKATDLTESGNKQAVADFVKQAAALEEAMLSKNVRIN